jgi:hypothetical protein
MVKTLSGLRGHRRRVIALAALVFLVVVGVVVATSSGVKNGTSPAATSPPVAPRAGVELAGWKLSIPEENDDGDATSIQPATIRAPWLTPASDGGLMFWAPTTGATTKNSEHPRTELQSLTYFKAATSGQHTLTASLTLLQLPQDGRGIILGQIHGADDISSVPYVMLRVQKGQLRVVVKQVQDGDDLIDYPLLANIGLNSRVDYTITDLGNGNMTFSATNNGATRQATAPVPDAFRGATVRFQAGDYQQANQSAGAQDGARVIFHQLAQQ